MSQPTSKQITVATTTLRSEATVWDQASTAVGGCADPVRALDTGSLQVSLFAAFAAAYSRVVDQTVQRCTEAQPALAEVGTTLRAAANTYDHEEAANEHRLRGLY